MSVDSCKQYINVTAGLLRSRGLCFALSYDFKSVALIQNVRRLVTNNNVGQIKIEEKELHSQNCFLKAIVSLSNFHER